MIFKILPFCLKWFKWINLPSYCIYTPGTYVIDIPEAPKLWVDAMLSLESRTPDIASIGTHFKEFKKDETKEGCSVFVLGPGRASRVSRKKCGHHIEMKIRRWQCLCKSYDQMHRNRDPENDWCGVKVEVGQVKRTEKGQNHGWRWSYL